MGERFIVSDSTPGIGLAGRDSARYFDETSVPFSFFDNVRDFSDNSRDKKLNAFPTILVGKNMGT